MPKTQPDGFNVSGRILGTSALQQPMEIVEITSNTTLTSADAGKVIMLVGSGDYTVTMPASPSNGDHYLFVKPVSGNLPTLNGNGNNFRGSVTGISQNVINTNTSTMSTENSTNTGRLEVIYYSTGGYWAIMSGSTFNFSLN
jgi:hypothetical protein